VAAHRGGTADRTGAGVHRPRHPQSRHTNSRNSRRRPPSQRCDGLAAAGARCAHRVRDTAPFRRCPRSVRRWCRCPKW
jgi:hypothetical protein